MTVRKLIAKLRKMDPDAEVGWADHDHSEDEINGRLREVSEASDFVREKYGVRVVLRP